MAILSGGPNSGFSGKAGSVIGYYRMGKWVIRGLPRLSRKNKKGSALQNVHRNRFIQVQQFLKPISGFIRIGFNLEAKQRGNTPYNSANSYLLLHAFDENGLLDYSKTKVTSGLLPGAEDAAVFYQDGEFIFTWSDHSLNPPYSRAIQPKKDDQVMLLIYNIKDKQIDGISSGARRSECREVLKLQAKLPEEEWHAWIAFISDDRESISNSEYLGIVRESSEEEA